jgi:hypothetical protein
VSRQTQYVTSFGAFKRAIFWVGVLASRGTRGRGRVGRARWTDVRPTASPPAGRAARTRRAHAAARERRVGRRRPLQSRACPPTGVGRDAAGRPSLPRGPWACMGTRALDSD